MNLKTFSALDPDAAEKTAALQSLCRSLDPVKVLNTCEVPEGNLWGNTVSIGRKMQQV